MSRGRMGRSDRAEPKSQQRMGLGQPARGDPKMGLGRVGRQQESTQEQSFHPGWRVPSRTHLRSHGPCCKHVPAVVEPVWLHLGVAGPVVMGEAVELGSALEDFHVVDQGLVACCDHWLILQSSIQEGGHSKTILLRAHPWGLLSVQAPQETQGRYVCDLLLNGRQFLPCDGERRLLWA